MERKYCSVTFPVVQPQFSDSDESVLCWNQELNCAEINQSRIQLIQVYLYVSIFFFLHHKGSIVQ